MNEQIEFVKEIARRLDSAGIFYMFTGSISMVFYATPRMTRDIDLVVQLTASDSQKLIDLFSDDCTIFLVSPEDLIISKLLWGKDSDSELQLRDIRNLLDSATGLDSEYLHFRAEKLGAGDYLKKAMRHE